MRRLALAGGMAALLAAVPVALSAQDACGEYGRIPAIGSYAEYRMTDRKGQATGMRFAVIGTESKDGKAMHWIELAMSGAKPDQSSIIQVLVPGYPYQPAGIEGLVMKPGNRPAMRAGKSMLGMMKGQLGKSPGMSAAEICKDVRRVGAERVTVPAGSYRAVHYRDDKRDSDVWVTRALPFGTVKAVGKDYEMVLTGTGKGAKSSITETPTEMGM